MEENKISQTIESAVKTHMGIGYHDLERDLDILAIKQCSLKSDIFRVSFSFYKASPHLMLVPKDTHSFPRRDISCLTPESQEELIRVARDVVDSLQDDDLNLILSIRRDEWVSKKKFFLAHIAFGEAGKLRYMELFDEVKKIKPMSDFWPSKGVPKLFTRAWSVHGYKEATESTIDELYETSVLSYPARNWKKEDLTLLKNTLDNPMWLKLDIKNLQFHDSLPQIGLPWPRKCDTSDTEHLLRYLMSLDNVVDAIRDQPKDYTLYKGSHVCVSLTGTGFQGFSSSRHLVLGYIQLSAPTFYRLCPPERRDTWLENYKKADGRVFT